MAVGFILLIAIMYASLALDETMKRQNMEKVLAPVGEYIGVNMLSTIGQIGMGRSTNQTLHVPLSKDTISGQYSIGMTNISGMWYAEIKSSKWPQATILQPLYLNASYVSADTRLQYPPYFCYNVTRNTTLVAGQNYHIYLNC